LQELRTNAAPGPLHPRLASAFLAPEQALRDHLTELDASLKARPASR
jgi:hypothetical protein